MYFEEEIIEGILCFRTSPNGAWRAYNREELTIRVGKYHSLQDTLFMAHQQAEDLLLALIGENSEIEAEETLQGLLAQIHQIVMNEANEADDGILQYLRDTNEEC